MKRKIILILVLCLSLALAIPFAGGCGSQNPDSSQITDGDNKGDAEPKEDKPQNPLQYFTIIFDSDGGSEVASLQVEKGNKIEEPKKPTKIENINGYDADYVFDGWFYGETKWDFASMTVTENLTLKARWHNEWAPPV